MAQERERRVAVPVEVRRLPEQRHEAVHTRELQDGVDGAVVEPADDGAEREPCADFRPEPRLPSSFVPGQRVGAECIAPQAVIEDLGGEAPLSSP